ncbi:MAG: FkbM family methyltransferase [Candidatus Thorarchaeota archaeon]|jgi:FkbM family methyltransferase
MNSVLDADGQLNDKFKGILPSNIGAAHHIVPVTLLDIGAAYGCICVSAHAAGTRYCYAIEPQKVYREFLYHNFQQVAHQSSIYKVDSRVCWNTASHRVMGTKNNRTYQDTAQYDAAEEPVKHDFKYHPERLSIPTISIYQVFDEIKRDLAVLRLSDVGLEFIKCDIEGGEFNIFERTDGFKWAIDELKVKYFDLEIHPGFLKDPSEYPTYTTEHQEEEMLDLFKEMGFKEDPILGKIDPYSARRRLLKLY